MIPRSSSRQPTTWPLQKLIWNWFHTPHRAQTHHTNTFKTQEVWGGSRTDGYFEHMYTHFSLLLLTRFLTALLHIQPGDIERYFPPFNKLIYQKQVLQRNLRPHTCSTHWKIKAMLKGAGGDRFCPTLSKPLTLQWCISCFYKLAQRKVLLLYQEHYFFVLAALLTPVLTRIHDKSPSCIKKSIFQMTLS